MEENKIELEARCILSNQNSLEESLKSQADEKQMTKSSNMVELQKTKRDATLLGWLVKYKGLPVYF